MFSKHHEFTESSEAQMTFLNNHTAKINEIAAIINQKMHAINEKMLNIKKYLRDDDEENKKVYIPLMNEIKDYFNFVQNASQSFPATNPILISYISYQLYQAFFSLIQFQSVELLFCAQTFDSDLLLAAARRANQCKNQSRNLILCDMNMCEDFIKLGVLIKNVVNVGILHHYIPVNLNEVLDESSKIETFCDEGVKQAVIDVNRLIPKFIKQCLIQNENNLKVVLRSCYGVELSDEKSIPQLSEVKAFPITIVPIDYFDVLPLDTVLKGHIVIHQTIVNKQYQTQLYLPNAEPLLLKEFPQLSTPNNFKLFAQKLINLFYSLNSKQLHINPYKIYIYPQHPYKGKKYEQGLKNFKEVFTQILIEWEAGVTKLNLPKIKYNSLFSTTTNLKNVTGMPAGSYGALLLDAIKNDCSYLAEFKAYYADYRAGPDRTILEVDVKGKNASSPKALIVSRNMFWGTKNSNSSITTGISQESPTTDSGLKC